MSLLFFNLRLFAVFGGDLRLLALNCVTWFFAPEPTIAEQFLKNALSAKKPFPSPHWHQNGETRKWRHQVLSILGWVLGLRGLGLGTGYSFLFGAPAFLF